MTLTLLGHRDLTSLSETGFFFPLTAIHANSLLKTSDFYRKKGTMTLLRRGRASEAISGAVSKNSLEKRMRGFEFTLILNPSPPSSSQFQFVHFFLQASGLENSHAWKVLICKWSSWKRSSSIYINCFWERVRGGERERSKNRRVGQITGKEEMA